MHNILPENLAHIFLAERQLSAARSGSKNRLSINKERWIENQKMELIAGQLNKIVYARHGRELMGLKSPVSVPCNVVKRNINY